MGEKKGFLRRFGNLVILATAAALIAGLVLMWRHCGNGGRGAGLGGGGGIGVGGGSKSGVGHDEGGGPAAKPAPAGPARCSLHLDDSGLTVDGKQATLQQAVETCAKAGEAEITFVGTTPFGRFEEIKKALEARHVKIDVRE